MTTTITAGAVVITPDLVLGYESETDSTNIAHRILGRADPDYTLGDDTPRTGTLELFFLEKAPAWAAQEAHRTAGLFELTDTDYPEIGMTYIRIGRMSMTLNNDRWVVSVGYQEVLP